MSCLSAPTKAEHQTQIALTFLMPAQLTNQAFVFRADLSMAAEETCGEEIRFVSVFRFHLNADPEFLEEWFVDRVGAG